jgi:hypothetical protein
VKDFLDREIEVGNWIIYGKRSGDSSETNLYRVTAIVDGKLKTDRFSRGYHHGPLAHTGKSTIFSSERVVVIPESYVPEEIVAASKENYK